MAILLAIPPSVQPYLAWALLVLSVTQALSPNLPLIGVGTSFTDSPDVPEDQVLFGPASYAFSIWAPIFIGCFVASIVQLLPSQRDRPVMVQMRTPAVIGFLICTVWSFAAIYQLDWLHPPLLFVLIVPLALANDAFIRPVEPLALWQHAVFSFPFGLYTGWVSLAAFVDFLTVSVTYGWSNSSFYQQEAWSVALEAAAGVLALLLTLLNRGHPWYTLAVVWGLIGVIVDNTAKTVGVDGSPAIVSLSVVLMVALLLEWLALVAHVAYAMFVGDRKIEYLTDAEHATSL